jgi:hypothetical protein
MKPYPVGTLVKIIHSVNFPELVGQICMITKEYQEFYDNSGGPDYWGYCLDISDEFGPEHWQLQPINDGDSNTVIS